MRIVLLDLDFYVEQDLLPTAFQRTATWLPHVATRTSLLRVLGVEALCNQHSPNCYVWHNNRLIASDNTHPLRIEDGDCVHIFIGDEDQRRYCLGATEDTSFLQTWKPLAYKIADHHERHPRLDSCDHLRGPRRRRRLPAEEPADDQRDLFLRLGNETHFAVVVSSMKRS